ncbi:hypothetical protein GOP47_0003416 [Adiantum capillus-veneris]|uniref:Uncharacterized protein n=1 Tax=Adiantum capillus-veneris TaxID=13818 RepID=A0A9D4VDR0_ADICA|nr:hypothetical protein GOP47_0003416 [Adiantum capillus-veneris]
MGEQINPSATYPTIEDIHNALKIAVDDALAAVKYEAGSEGWPPTLFTAEDQTKAVVADQGVLEKKIRQLTIEMMGLLRLDHHTDSYVLALACQLHHLYSIYFTGRPQIWRDCNPNAVVGALAYKAIRVDCGRLWPEGCWIGTLHKPNPTWLSEQEYTSVVGDIEYAVEYKKMLHRLGYAPLTAPTKEALDKIWHDLYILNIDLSSTGPPPPPLPPILPISPLDKYAVVSYVQCADRTKPPATWTAEVDSVLTALVQSGIITEKVLWFDKLASRQYKDSQLWWGASATMQFLFNPVIVILPRMSEHSSFAPSVGSSIWGADEAVDAMYKCFLAHAHNCKECQSSFALKWALQQDHVIPAASLRTWPRVEHALGASGLGLFTSETTYSALVACLTCAFAMFGAILKNYRALYHALKADATPLPSTYVREDGSILVAGWVIVSCSRWHYSFDELVNMDMEPLKEMASCLMELHHLFCQLQSPRLVTLGRTSQNGINMLVYEGSRLPELPGLFYLKDEEDVDVPTLARFNTNNTYRLFLSHRDEPEDVVVALHHHWALAEIQKNQPQEDIITTSFVAARHRALSTLVYTKAAQAPCYAWDDKLVAAILLSLPNLFAEAVTYWNKGSEWLTHLSSEVLLEVGITDQNIIEWEPNALIVALAMLKDDYNLHRLVPRPSTGIHKAMDRPVKVQSLEGDGCHFKSFAAFFLGQLPHTSLDALCFRNAENMKVKEWVYKMLQDGALCNINVVVLRSLLPAGESKDKLHCWHCRNRRGENRNNAGVVIDFAALQQFVDDILSNDQSEPCAMWGLGSFDPLNLGDLCDEDSFFGERPDTVAVLLKRRQSTDDSAGSTSFLHAYALANFCILGSRHTHKCNDCHAIIILEKDHGKPMAMWTIIPLLGYKLPHEFIPGFAEIR